MLFLGSSMGSLYSMERFSSLLSDTNYCSYLLHVFIYNVKITIFVFKLVFQFNYFCTKVSAFLTCGFQLA